jgi:hypothetical protein
MINNKGDQKMKKMLVLTSVALVFFFTLSGFMTASAQNKNVAGKWQAEWNAGIGIMTCNYTFKVDGNVLTGNVSAEMNGTESESEITDGKIEGDKISFTWVFDKTVKMVTTGNITGEEIKLTRKPGRYATEEAVAMRIK